MKLERGYLEDPKDLARIHYGLMMVGTQVNLKQLAKYSNVHIEIHLQYIDWKVH